MLQNRNETHQNMIDTFFIPFAGGNRFSYRAYERIPKTVMNMHVVELPGRMSRYREALVTDLYALAYDVFKYVRSRIGVGSFVLYGHSMGAILAYLVSVLLRDAGLQLPEHLFVTGAEGPSSAREEKKHLLSNGRFIAELKKLQGSSEDFLTNQDLLEFYLPVIRADFQASENYVHEPAPPLNIPMTVITGADDDMTLSSILLWKQVSEKSIDFIQMPGGHFFFTHHAKAIIRIMEEKILTACESNFGGKREGVSNQGFGFNDKRSD